MARRTATGPNGEKLVLEGGKWIPMGVPAGFVGPQDEFTGLDPSLGRTREEQGKNAAQGWRAGIGALAANTLSLPHAAGELLAAGGAVPALVPGGETFSEARARGEKQFPASALLAMPDPSTEDVLAVPSAIKKSLADPMIHRRRLLGTRFDEAVAEERAKADASPIASGAGQTIGDISTLLTLRPGKRLTDLLRMNPRASLADTKGVLDAAARTLTRGTARTAEAGFDGAVMGALSDADPVRTAAWSAGIQAGGSAALAAKNAFFRNPLKSFAALYLGHEMWKAVAPGPQDLFDSKDTAVTEMVTAYGLGAAAAMAGSTRGVGTGNVLRLTDALSSASRATVASVVSQLQSAAADNKPHYARVLELMSQDQERFGTDARVLLERAARSEEPRALLNQIDALMQSARFRKALEDEPEAQPEAPQSFGNWLMRR